MLKDSSGRRPVYLDVNGVGLYVNNSQPVYTSIMNPVGANIVNSSHEDNRRPNTGEPGSTYVAPNGDTRTYGPDGKPEHDYDHNDHGRPDKHPHDPNGGHHHDWENGIRGPAYESNDSVFLGVALVTVSAVAIAILAADDLTLVGIADDVAIGPLVVGIGEGVNIIFN